MTGSPIAEPAASASIFRRENVRERLAGGWEWLLPSAVTVLPDPARRIVGRSYDLTLSKAPDFANDLLHDARCAKQQAVARLLPLQRTR